MYPAYITQTSRQHRKALVIQKRAPICSAPTPVPADPADKTKRLREILPVRGSPKYHPGKSPIFLSEKGSRSM
jgi:hypothetical protein